MPTKDFVVKLVGDSKSYQSAMDQATRALNKFESQNLSVNAAMKTVTTTLSKVISVTALVKGAQEALSATIKGSQTTADEYVAAIDGCKNAVSTFFTALSSGDFSSFTQGLDKIILKGSQASKAMDQLADTVRSYNYLSASNNAAFNENLLTMRNVNATSAERAAAKAEAQKQLQYAQDLATGKEAALMDAILKNAVKKSPLSASMFNVDDINRISQLDAFAKSPELLAKFGLQSKDYYLAQAQEYAQLIKAARPQDEYIRPDLYRSEAGRAEAAQIAERNRAAQAAFREYEAVMQEEYRFALEVKALLEDMTDEEVRSNIFNLATDIQNTKQGVTQMERQLLMASGELKRGGFKTDTGTPNASAPSSGRMMTGLEYDRMMYQERIKLSQKWSEEYVDLQMQLRETEYQIQVERLTSTIQNEEQLAEALKVAEQVKQQDLYNIAMDGYIARLTAAGNFAEQEEDIIDNTAAMKNHIEAVRTLSSAFAQLGGAMASTGDKAAASAGAIITATTQALPALQTLFTTASTAAVAEGIAETPTLGGKLAAGLTLTATILSLVSTLKGIQNYAEGGVIPGHNWNDGITARVSSGEMVINEADQKRLYDSIHTGNIGGGGGGPAYISGEQIVLAVNNYGRRTNQGELVFAGR